ncbi:MAG: DUF3137 domain-containing protein [Alphaproteobacteria bacterium]|nr:DUF3137 domain-containing protein [Alphaproteobacteria bacterium]
MPKRNYELASLQQNFKSFYDANLRRKYEQLEPARQKYLGIFKTRFIICAAIVLGVVFLCMNGTICKQTYTAEWFFKLSILVIVGMFYLCSLPFKDYRIDTKSLVMDKILSFWGTFKYSVLSTIDDEDIKNSELFARYDKDKTDDSFSGMYNDTRICVSEKNLLVKGNKNDYSVFRGVLILLEFEKSFDCKTVVKHRWNLGSLWKNNFQLVLALLMIVIAAVALIQIFVMAEDAFETALFIYMFLFFAIISVICLLGFHKQRKKATQQVKLEEISFNKNWNVLTDNQVEARYILTPVFMEKINEVKKLFYGKHIDFSFFDNKLLLAVHTRKNMFETTTLLTPALDYHKVREVVSQLHSIFSVIDVLNSARK